MKRVLSSPKDTRMSLARSCRGRLGITLKAPPMPPSPYSTEEGPFNTSMRSTPQVSKGKVMVLNAV